MHYVLIDFENVQPTALGSLGRENVKLLVFVGASQTKVAIDLAAALQPLGSHAEYVRISGNGSNALDFHIAYYIGRLAALDPTATFHIVSKDTGFDPLLTHLKAAGIAATRVKTATVLALGRPATAGSAQERLDTTLTWLQASKASKPRTVKTLSSSIAALFKKQLSPEEVAAVVAALAEHGYVTLTGSKVSYAHSDA